MRQEPTPLAGLHPIVPGPDELNQAPTASAGPHPSTHMLDEVGDDEYVELKKVLKLEAAIDFALTVPMRTTYKPLGLVSGWFWRDAKFHTALGTISEKAIARGEGAKSAIVCRAANDGQPTRPGRQFYEMVERARKIKIPKLPTGEYDPVEAEKVWIGEMVKLGFNPVGL